jgi:FlaA1/EpsC-like NDP-sugar epimerase
MIAFTDRELEWLMDRKVCKLLTAADRQAYQGRRILITGAGGSIGSELARQLAQCQPAMLTILDNSELNLFQVERQLRDADPGLNLDVVLGDVSRRAMRHACRSSRPDVVFHAAAYKHVTMVERAVCPAIETNVVGTIEAVEAAREVGARFVLISSDKAASPRSVMGATKRLAELIALSRATDAFRPIVIRFGNVLGSSGSVLTVMRDAIRAKMPVPVTDLNATRYFMTAGEAVSLVLKADLLARRPETYWLDMGEPVRIGDLVDRMMTLEELAGHETVPVKIIGLRAGEKLREELTTQGLRMCRTSHRRIWVATQMAADLTQIRRAERRLRARVAHYDAAGALAWLAAAVPEFVVSAEASSMAQAQRLIDTPDEALRHARTA